MAMFVAMLQQNLVASCMVTKSSYKHLPYLCFWISKDKKARYSCVVKNTEEFMGLNDIFCSSVDYLR